MASPYPGAIPGTPTNISAGSDFVRPPDSPASAEHTSACPALQLLTAMWRSDKSAHFISIHDQKNGGFRNQSVSDIATAIEQAKEYSRKGFDVYFACSEYKTTENRKKENVAGANGFWLDIDCGEDKASAGKGYRTIAEAEQALNSFCEKANLPFPTHIVLSGRGLHVYWVLAERLGRLLWAVAATKLKELTVAEGLLADPSRTSDEASVMRLPGTNNHKTGEPRSVTLKVSSAQYIEREGMLDAIDAATVTLQVVKSVQVAKAVQVRAPMVPEPFEEDIDRDPPNLLGLASALKVLSPDCDEKTWKFHRLAPMAYEARYFPGLHDALYKLARDWSSGDLGGVPSTKWNEHGSNGVSGKQCFDRVWKRFLTDNYTGKRVTLGTIFWGAQQEGWVYSQDDGGVADDKAVP